jgi:hypothetical protein
MSIILSTDVKTRTVYCVGREYYFYILLRRHFLFNEDAIRRIQTESAISEVRLHDYSKLYYVIRSLESYTQYSIPSRGSQVTQYDR